MGAWIVGLCIPGRVAHGLTLPWPCQVSPQEEKESDQKSAQAQPVNNRPRVAERLQVVFILVKASRPSRCRQ